MRNGNLYRINFWANTNFYIDRRLEVFSVRLGDNNLLGIHIIIITIIVLVYNIIDLIYKGKVIISTRAFEVVVRT